MGSYEGVQETRQTVAQANVLTADMRRGDFSGVPGDHPRSADRTSASKATSSQAIDWIRLPSR